MPPNLPLVVDCFLAAALVTVAFVGFEARAVFPVVDVALLKRRAVAYMMALNFCYGFGMFPALTFLPLYGQLKYGFSIAESGALLTPRAIASVVVSPLAAFLLLRTGYRKPVSFGLASTGTALFLLSLGGQAEHRWAAALRLRVDRDAGRVDRGRVRVRRPGR
ncbi:MAG: hypothetical protein EXR68_01615 [Dehalococcoidia bacterium]|nr:hypothetical protein [Dehalococcoidia bacterium]